MTLRVDVSNCWRGPWLRLNWFPGPSGGHRQWSGPDRTPRFIGGGEGFVYNITLHLKATRQPHHQAASEWSSCFQAFYLYSIARSAHLHWRPFLGLPCVNTVRVHTDGRPFECHFEMGFSVYIMSYGVRDCLEKSITRYNGYILRHPDGNIMASLLTGEPFGTYWRCSIHRFTIVVPRGYNWILYLVGCRRRSWMSA